MPAVVVEMLMQDSTTRSTELEHIRACPASGWGALSVGQVPSSGGRAGTCPLTHSRLLSVVAGTEFVCPKWELPRLHML